MKRPGPFTTAPQPSITTRPRMNLSSEQVHWLGGLAFIVVSLLGLAQAGGQLPGRWVSWLIAALFVGYGVESFADVWLHGSAAPANYAPETRQHLLQGGSLLLAGLIEALVLGDLLEDRAWRFALPAALAVTATVFAVHTQHGPAADAAAMMLMQVQHRAFAIALYTAAVVRALELRSMPSAASIPSQPRPPEPTHATANGGLAGAWLLPLFIFGVQMVVYTESAMGHS